MLQMMLTKSCANISELNILPGEDDAVEEGVDVDDLTASREMDVAVFKNIKPELACPGLKLIG